MSGFMVLQVTLEDIEKNEKGERRIRDTFEDHEKTSFVGRRWCARYSAPGYMDCTDYVIGDAIEGPIDVARECFAMYGYDEPGSDDRRELAQVIRQARAQGHKR